MTINVVNILVYINIRNNNLKKKKIQITIWNKKTKRIF